MAVALEPLGYPLGGVRVHVGDDYARAPSSASLVAIAFPMPAPPPVTMTRLPPGCLTKLFP